jgi:hypothetical protein
VHNVQGSNRTCAAGCLDSRGGLVRDRAPVGQDDADVGGVEHTADGDTRELGPGAEVGDHCVEAVGDEDSGDAASDGVGQRGAARWPAEDREPLAYVDERRLADEFQAVACAAQVVVAEPLEPA